MRPPIWRGECQKTRENTLSFSTRGSLDPLLVVILLTVAVVLGVSTLILVSAYCWGGR